MTGGLSILSYGLRTAVLRQRIPLLASFKRTVNELRVSPDVDTASGALCFVAAHGTVDEPGFGFTSHEQASPTPSGGVAGNRAVMTDELGMRFVLDAGAASGAATHRDFCRICV